MPELSGQMDILDAIEDELNGEPTPARAIKILDQARDLGWRENPFCSFAVRLERGDGLPFYAVWHLSHNPETGKRSWRFASARAQNGQPLTFGDIKTYLEDPSVIYPEPPDELCEAAGHEDPEMTLEAAAKAAEPLTRPSVPIQDWSVLFR